MVSSERGLNITAGGPARASRAAVGTGGTRQKAEVIKARRLAPVVILLVRTIARAVRLLSNISGKL
jgi:hypothetical protein